MTAFDARPIRVLCVDDQPVVRHSLSVALLAFEDIEAVGEAASGEEAVRLCETALPHVVLMDIVMPGMGGVAATRTIRERWPQIQVVGLTSFVEPALLAKMYEAGASSCLVKTGSSKELVDAIRGAHEALGVE